MKNEKGNKMNSLTLIRWTLGKFNFVCPRCNNPLFKQTHCSNCGQPINWSDMK